MELDVQRKCPVSEEDTEDVLSGGRRSVSRTTNFQKIL